ncbi:MAG: TIM barrel protein [Spirochaetota bacterium]|nr:TIM barrel protein [Spirochaetota bacterium]
MKNSDFLSGTNRNIFINMPIRKIDDRYMELIESHRFNLEIGIDYYSLDHYSSKDFGYLADRLLNLGITMTVHAPFNELFLGSPDRLIREASLSRIDSAFDAMFYFSPISVVLHLNYEEKRFGYMYDEWFSYIIPNLIRYAEKCDKMGAILVIENVYEETPDVISSVIERMHGYPVYHCIDVGHINAFSRLDVKEWIDMIGKHIRHFHLHDNDGSKDAHDPIGKGNIDFTMIVDFIDQMKQPPIITLEPHTEEDLWSTLEGATRIALL